MSPTVEQVRGSFANAGFQIDSVQTWGWTSPPVSTVQVHDRASGRVVIALVYPQTAAAQAARLQSQFGRPLVAGYGLSVWRGNVALVQTTQSELERIFRWQNDCDTGVLVDSASANSAGQTNDAVDVDFLQALDAVSFAL